MIVTRVGEALGLLDVVRRHQDRRALAAQPVDQRPQLLADLRVQADGRLVEQHEPRPVHERRARSAAAGACRRRACRPSCRARSVEVRDLQRALDRRACARARHAGRGARTRAGSARRSASRRGCRAAARRRTRRAPPWSRSGSRRPSTSISPSSAIACAVSSRIVVDLPAPLGPSRPTHVPSGTSRSRWSTAVSAPKRLTTPRRRMAGGHPPEGVRRRRAVAVREAAATRASNSGRCGRRSSRRATARRRRSRAPSIASIVPSAARPTTAQAVADRVDRLVVERVHRERARARRSGAGASAAAISTSCVASVAGSLWRWPGDVLVQRAAAGDVERLRAAADRQDRQAALQRQRARARARRRRGSARSGRARRGGRRAP